MSASSTTAAAAANSPAPCTDCFLQHNELFPVPDDKSGAMRLCDLCYTLRVGEKPPRPPVELTPRWTWCNFRRVFCPSYDAEEFEREDIELEKEGLEADEKLVDLQAYPHRFPSGTDLAAAAAEAVASSATQDKPILIINTGGTLSCTYNSDGLLAPEPLCEYLQQHIACFGKGNLMQEEEYLRQKSKIDGGAAKRPEYIILESSEHLMLDSTNSDWSVFNLLLLLISTRQCYTRAVIIIHGTDTLAYTSSAMTFGLWNLQIPVVVVGSQTPLRTCEAGDARGNLLLACEFAKIAAVRRLIFVFVCFHCKILLGHRVSKTHTSNFDAFSSHSVGVAGYYNGHFELNESLMAALTQSRFRENRLLRQHVENNREYYESLSPTLFTDGSMEASPLLASPNPPITTPATSCYNAAEYGGMQNHPSQYAVSLHSLLPFRDEKHKSVVHRFHEGCSVVVYFTRPGPSHDGARTLREQIIDKCTSDPSKCVGLLVLGFGAGNAPDDCLSVMQWARERLSIPTCWGSQCPGVAGGHYAAGMRAEHGSCLFDMNFEAAYCRFLNVLSQHLFYAQRQGVAFKRSALFRDAVESWMSVPHKLCFTVDPAKGATLGASADWAIVHDSAVAKYQ